MTVVKPDYRVKIFNNSTWQDIYPKSVSVKKGLLWDNAPTASMEMDNKNGTMRTLCKEGRLVKIYAGYTPYDYDLTRQPTYSGTSTPTAITGQTLKGLLLEEPDTLTLTRAHLLNYITGSVFDLSKGTLDFLVYVNEAVLAADWNHYLFYHSTGNNCNVLALSHYPDGRWNFWTTDANGLNCMDLFADDIEAGNLIMVSATWDEDEASLWINGEKLATTTTVCIPTVLSDLLYIGHDGDGLGYLNTWLAGIMISDRRRHDDDMTARGTAHNLEVDSSTVYYLPLQENNNAVTGVAPIFYGKIIKPLSSVSNKGQSLSIDMESYYYTLLRNKQTGENTIWSLTNQKPSDLIKAFIGTKFIVQDLFDNNDKVSSLANLCLQDSHVTLNKDSSGNYYTSGTLISEMLQNGDWGTMGDISAATVYVYPTDEGSGNKAPNADFEFPMYFTAGNGYTDRGWLAADTTGGIVEEWTSETTPHSGAGCFRIFIPIGNSNNAVVKEVYPLLSASAGQTWRYKAYVKGTGYAYLTIGYQLANGTIGYNSGASLTLTDTWTAYERTYVLPANTVRVFPCMEAWNNTQSIAVDAYFDDLEFNRILGSDVVDVSISIDDGAQYTDASMTYNSTNKRWEGSIASFPASTIKNKFRYKLIVNRESATSSPEIDGIDIFCTTASDTGITEGTIEEFVAPADDGEIKYKSTLDKDYGESDREACISSVVKVTSMDTWIDDATGKINSKVRRGQDLSVVLSIGKNINALTNDPDMTQMCNALTFVGSGQISSSKSFVHRTNLMDQASIDEHGRFEKFLSEKDLPNPYMVNLRAYKILTDLKAPIRTVKAVIIDNFSAHLFDIGDTVLVNDTTRSTGIQNERLKVISIDRTLDESGRETVSIELSNSKYNSSKAARFESYASNIENYMSTEQNAGDSVVYPFSGDISAAAPGDLMFYLDEGREVVGIELICASSKYRSYGASSITEFANYAPCQLFINGISTAEPMFSTQGSFATSFTLKRLNLMPLYEADAASVITKGFNKFQFKPLTDAGLNVNGLLRLNALVKVTYSS